MNSINRKKIHTKYKSRQFLAYDKVLTNSEANMEKWLRDELGDDIYDLTDDEIDEFVKLFMDSVTESDVDSFVKNMIRDTFEFFMKWLDKYLEENYQLTTPEEKHKVLENITIVMSQQDWANHHLVDDYDNYIVDNTPDRSASYQKGIEKKISDGETQKHRVKEIKNEISIKFDTRLSDELIEQVMMKIMLQIVKVVINAVIEEFELILNGANFIASRLAGPKDVNLPLHRTSAEVLAEVNEKGLFEGNWNISSYPFELQV